MAKQKLTTFLMFEGKAEEAMDFYISLFENSKIDKIARYTKDGPGKEGSVILAEFTLNGRNFMAIDSFVKHAFTFTPAMSIYVECESEAQIDELYKKLIDGGQALMGLDNHGFSKKFGWVNDRFGVSWQMNLQ